MKKLYKKFLKYLCRKAGIIIDITVACDEFTIQVEDGELKEYKGKASCLGLWRRALTEKEIAHLYESLK